MYDQTWVSGIWDKIPDKAVMTRNKDVDIIVARTWHQGELLPGYVRDGWGYFCYKGNVIKRPLKSCQILVSYQVGFALHIRCELEDYLPVGVDAGSKHLYMGTFNVDGITLCGEVRDGVCNIAGIDGKVRTETYEYSILARLWKPYSVDPWQGPSFLEFGKWYRQK